VKILANFGIFIAIFAHFVLKFLEFSNFFGKFEQKIQKTTLLRVRLTGCKAPMRSFSAS